MEWLQNVNWFAVHTKRYKEAFAASSLGGLGIEVFLPIVKVEYCGGDAVKLGTKPLFPAYLFARFAPADSLGPVECACGVLHVVKSSSRPIPVEDRVVREIQDRVRPDGLIRLQPRVFRPGQAVSIEDGPFAGMLARVERELDDGRRVALFLEALWNARVLVEKPWVTSEAA